MKQPTYIRAIATFLITVFSLNTVVGFACSIGVNMGFNSIMSCADVHAAKRQTKKSHNHNGKSHDHKGKSHHDKSKPHDHNGTSKGHQSKSKDHHAVKDESCGKNKNCCKDKVKQFQQLDKQTTGGTSAKAVIQSSQTIQSYSHFDVAVPHNTVVKDVKPFVRSYHPPIADIIIQIQSFRI